MKINDVIYGLSSSADGPEEAYRALGWPLVQAKNGRLADHRGIRARWGLTLYHVRDLRHLLKNRALIAAARAWVEAQETILFDHYSLTQKKTAGITFAIHSTNRAAWRPQ